MRRPLLLAAALSSAVAVALGSSPAKADQFTISAASPGTVNFSGSGTATFNNSLGTNNSFQVGSATSLGVNASTSSTPEYGVTSTADLMLSGSTQLQQKIGTSGTESSRQHERARTHANSRMAEQGWGVSWDRENQNAAGNKGYSSEGEWRVARDAAYKSEYSSAFTTTQTNGTSQDGTISGSFKTVENSRAGAGGNSSSWAQTATAAVDVEYGASYENRSGTYEAMGKVEWEAARESAYNREYASASASNNRYSDSQVTVTGIGSDANIVALDESSFTTTITRNSDLAGGGGSTATANGSAGASLSTVSLANQSQSQTASAFIQSFGGSTSGGIDVVAD